MRICYFGTYERDYPRNALLIEALQRAGVTVYACHSPVWELQRDKSGVYRGMAAVLTILRLLLAYLRLAVQYVRLPRHDLVIVGYVGQFDMPLAWLLARLRAVPLVFNPLVSLYDTFCDDRGLVKPDSAAGRALHWLDRLACRLADAVLIDTDRHRQYFHEVLGVPQAKLRVVPVGADDRVFVPLPARAPDDLCRVLFVGKLIPLHGVETILRAADLLRDEAFQFTIVGSGQEAGLVQRLCAELQLGNVTQINWVEYAELPATYARADICLGVFGGSQKAARVIPNKAFQALACARPLITADTPAIRDELLPDADLLVCRPEDPAALAAQIRRLTADPALRSALAERGYRRFLASYGLDALSHTLRNALADLLPGLASGDQMDWGEQPEFYGPRHRYREDYLFAAVRRYAPGPVILDAACGAGTLARRLSANGYLVSALDLSRNFLSYLRKHSDTAGLALQQGDLTQLPFRTASIDAVVAGEVLEHLPDDQDRAALHEIARVLRPGGVCVISVPAEPDQWDWHDNWAGHVQRYTRDAMRERLVAAGLEVLNIHHFGFPFVRAFHQYVYLPRYRRALQRYRGRLEQLSTHGWRYQLASRILLAVFQFDRCFNHLPYGIGLIAIARKPHSSSNHPTDSVQPEELVFDR